MTWYTIKALDSDGYELSVTEESSLKAAKLSAREKAAQPDLLAAGLHKVEVLNESGECIYDRFAQVGRICGKTVENGPGTGVCQNEPNHTGDCDDVPY